MTQTVSEGIGLGLTPSKTDNAVFEKCKRRHLSCSHKSHFSRWKSGRKVKSFRDYHQLCRDSERAEGEYRH